MKPRTRLWAVASALAATIAMWSGAACAQAQASTRRGSEIAYSVCAACHGTRVGEVYSPNPFAPSFEDIANTPGMTAAALRVALNTSHRTMPNIILNNAQQRDIIAYILTMQDKN